jgi:hypothetical protein
MRHIPTITTLFITVFVLYKLFYTPAADPQALAFAPIECEYKVVVTGVVLLSHVLEIHPTSPAVPDAYTAIDFDLWDIGPDTLLVAPNEPEGDILGRVKSPAKQFLIREWLSYRIRPIKRLCPPDLPQDKPKPKPLPAETK